MPNRSWHATARQHTSRPIRLHQKLSRTPHQGRSRTSSRPRPHHLAQCHHGICQLPKKNKKVEHTHRSTRKQTSKSLKQQRSEYASTSTKANKRVKISTPNKNVKHSNDFFFFARQRGERSTLANRCRYAFETAHAIAPTSTIPSL